MSGATVAAFLVNTEACWPKDDCSTDSTISAVSWKRTMGTSGPNCSASNTFIADVTG